MSSHICKRFFLERHKEATNSIMLSTEARSESLEMWSTIEKVTPKRRHARTPKHVEACDASEDMSDLTISSNKVLKEKTSN